jgi:glycine/D-amino acid oxidase-like deaminating enzyme
MGINEPQTEGHETYDVVVLGAGGAGMAAALFAAIEGLRPLLIERTEYVGGTTALSAGSVWIPNTEAGLAVNPSDTPARTLAYIRRAAGPRADEALQCRFVGFGPEAVATLERASEVKLRAFAHHPDYLSDLDGATTCGRVLEPAPFDGRQLGADLALVRPPIPEFTLFGGMMVDRADIGHLLNARRSARSLRYVAKLVARHAADRARGRRSSRLVMGNALVGRLLASLKQRGVPIRLETEVSSLDGDRAQVTGVTVRRGGATTKIAARAVVLAGGGFNRNSGLRGRLLPESIIPACAPGGDGRLLGLALGLGARLGPEDDAAFLAPVSLRRRKDGSQAVFPHFVLDRAKPGTLVVDASGRRFTNESASYDLFAKAMIAANATTPAIPAFLIADRRAVAKYGLGMVRPGGWGLRGARRDGYLVSAPTLAGLAEALGIDPAGLAASVARLNGFARTGIDEDFWRGTTLYERNLGDPAVGPNPTLAPLEAPPFYALPLFPGDIGSSTGLLTDPDSRVMGPSGPIRGLYAVGNDMQSVMGGAYPGPGITLGPALVFAFAAARAAARELAHASAPTP